MNSHQICHDPPELGKHKLPPKKKHSADEPDIFVRTQVNYIGIMYTTALSHRRAEIILF
jgi:hypothetical protein